MEARLLLTLGNIAAMGAAALTPVPVVFAFGASQTEGVAGLVTEIPSGFYTTDAHAYLWDKYLTSTIIPLPAPSYAVVTISNASPGVVTWTGHGLSANAPFSIESTGTPPTGTAVGTRYYVKTVVDANSFTISATVGGAAINTSSAGSGVHTGVANGGVECQPSGPASGTPSPIGWAGEFLKHYRVDNPSTDIYFFVNQIGGGRFSDAASSARAANYKYNLTDGAYANMLASWTSFVAALAAIGKTPNIILVMDDSIGNGANDLTGTEAGAYQTDMTNLMTQARTDIFGSSVKWVHYQISTQQTVLNAGNRATIAAAQQAIVLAAPTTNALLQCDGMPTGADALHDKASSTIAKGEILAYEAQNLWHPLKEWTFLGGNQTARVFRPGDFRNTAGATAFTLTGGNIATCWDCAVGSLSPTQATNTKRPTITTTTLANGYVARLGLGDGATQILTATAGVNYSSAANFGLFAAAQSVSNTVLDCLFGEGSSSSANPSYQPMSQDGSTTGMLGLAKNDAGTTFLNNTLGAGAWDGNMNFLATWGSASTISGQVNGTAGTPVSITRGTVTINRFSLFGIIGNNVESHQINAKLGIFWVSVAQPDATYLANARAYTQRRWGTA